MNKEISRREFLGAVGSGAILGAAGVTGYELSKLVEEKKEYGRTHEYDHVFKTDFEKNNPELTFESACDIAERFDKLYDSLPPYDYHPTLEDVDNWVLEIYPMFAYNGIAPRTDPPKRIGTLAYTSPRQHNHVLGQSDCTNIVALNYRLFNPVSSWYDSPAFLSVLTHELAHTLQGDLCAGGSIVENSAQIAMLETLASLANRKNDLVLHSLINEIGDIFYGAAYSIALRTDRMTEFDQLGRKLNSRVSERSSSAAARRRWDKDQLELKRILKTYQETPAEMIIQARFNDGKIEGLAFPPIYPPGYYGQTSFEQLPIYLDDLLYFVSNSEAIVEEYIKSE